METYCIIIKIAIIIALIIIFLQLYYKRDILSILNVNLEGFEDGVQNQNVDYLKLKETYIEPEGTSLQLLYANYYGEEINADIWKDKTLEQCTDLCNELNGCKGFSRKANIADTAKDECYPRTKIGICHSVRKGDDIQMQNAIKYNSYIKNGRDKKVLTKCIGDPEMTLKRNIYIKSQMFPNKFIGTLGDGLAMLIDKNTPDFEQKCRFSVDVGLDGLGTISFQHKNSGKYLSRMPSSTITPSTTAPSTTIPGTTIPGTTIPSTTMNAANSRGSYEFIGLRDVDKTSTSDKQRASFNILDSMINMVKFKCLRVNGENVDKYIVINHDNNSYLLCSEIANFPTEQLFTFDIVDTIISSKIYNHKDNIAPQITTTPTTTTPTTTTPTTNVTKSNKRIKDAFFSIDATDAIGNALNTSVTGASGLSANNLDVSNQLTLYQNLFEPQPDRSGVTINEYLNDNYTQQFNQFNSINKKVNDITLQKQLSSSLSRNQDAYKALNQLNQEIEREIAGLNMGLNAKNDKIVQGINKMQLTDMASDYYTLKNAYPLAISN